ncbi:hypothetical protein DXH95_08720 [Sphingorhabdus pulchriflava]|uniref:Uncharacterized protein n=1 Tax=Sphingorhabdus pulchriflava TaxID=2292257 RepID=A0A371BII5_9SPHN|nr:hypothetical protein [Sphingorhabdus pulchriflava]RDV07412.1 hypothetical protein DXH95_08720 [Sphingorhabdus pulchriflava]
MKKTGKLAATMLASAAMLAQSTVALAETPGSVRDLVGARAAGGESTLAERGFTMHHGTTKNDSKIGYWWNPNTKECVSVTTYDGKFEAIKKVSASDCGQKSSNNDAGVAVAVGAAAILGAIALSHKSDHHNDSNHYNDSQREADYERGYRDGLYNQAYHNYGRSDAYSDGYSSGVEQRGHETSYRNNNHHSGGYVANVYVGDLNGQSRDNATSQLMSRGFVMRDDKRTDDGRYRTFWNASSKQCLVMVSRNGYVSSLDHVSKSTCRD